MIKKTTELRIVVLRNLVSQDFFSRDYKELDKSKKKFVDIFLENE